MYDSLFKIADEYARHMSYSIACELYGTEKLSFDDLNKYRSSFECWFKENWWNSNWEYLIDDFTDGV